MNSILIKSELEDQTSASGHQLPFPNSPTSGQPVDAACSVRTPTADSPVPREGHVPGSVIQFQGIALSTSQRRGWANLVIYKIFILLLPTRSHKQ